MPESAETPSTFASLTLTIETPAIKERPSTIAVEKRYFADVWSVLTGQERQKYNPITSTKLKELTWLNSGNNWI